MAGAMDIDRDPLNSRWHEIETRLNQIAAAPGLDQEICRSEVERLFSEQDRIEYVLSLDRPADAASQKSSGLPWWLLSHASLET
jgi:hypothetical protein